MKFKGVVPILLLAAFLSTAAVAEFRRQSGFFCMPTSEQTIYEAIPGQGLVSRGRNQFRCPLFDDSLMATPQQFDNSRAAISGVNVHVAGSGGQATSATLCVTFATSAGSSCSQATYAYLNGAATISMTSTDARVWNVQSQSAYAHVLVDLCPDCSIFGYFTY
jgi:hypothetical protein